MPWWRVLRPRDTPTRERRALNQAVAVRFDADGAGRRDGWFDGRYATPARYRAASCSDLFADERVRDHVSDARYQTTVRVPAGRAERRR
jgi:beta-glucuronidase